MLETVTLKTFFRTDGGTDPDVGPERYVAGYEDGNGAPWGVQVPLDPELVEARVFEHTAFSISIDTRGTFLIETQGRGDGANEALQMSCSNARIGLDEVVRLTLDPDLLAMEDDVTASLMELRDRLAAALGMVDAAIRETGQ